MLPGPWEQAPGVEGGPDGHHGINEIWLNDYNKWFLSDAKYDHHFEKDGIPLSALEVRDEYLKNKAADIIKVKGPAAFPRTRILKQEQARNAVPRPIPGSSIHTHNDMFTAWPEHETLLSMYEDDYFKNNTWIWGGNPHWAYAKPEFMRLVKDRDAIEWTPNTIASEIQIEGNVAKIRLTSETPNLKEYQMKEGMSGDWQAVDESFSMDLNRKRHEWYFRTVNLAGCIGSGT